MRNGFLAQEAKRQAGVQKKMFKIFGIVAVLAFLVLALAFVAEGEEAAGYFEDYSGFFIGVPVFLVLCAIVVFIRRKKRWSSYSNILLVHRGEAPPEAVGRVIDEEAAQGKILVDEYKYSDGKKDAKKGGARLVLLPSYLLICEERVIAIPTNKIFWVCSQNMGEIMVRIKIFAENQMYDSFDGVEREHFNAIANRLYQYIPNIFSGYDVLDLSYKLQDVFLRDYNQFLQFYERHWQDFYANTRNN